MNLMSPAILDYVIAILLFIAVLLLVRIWLSVRRAEKVSIARHQAAQASYDLLVKVEQSVSKVEMTGKKYVETATSTLEMVKVYVELARSSFKDARETKEHAQAVVKDVVTQKADELKKEIPVATAEMIVQEVTKANSGIHRKGEHPPV